MKEIELINDIKRRVGKLPKAVAKGIGDDCAVLDMGGDDYLLWAQDMIIEGTHFDLKIDKYKDVGRKAVAVNISDITAMGGKPEYVQISLGIPSGLRQTNIDALTSGIFSILKEYNIKLLGGDTVKSDKLVIDISIMGRVNKKKIALRSKAKSGDFILITGPVRNGKKEHLTFTPRIKESKYLMESFKVNAMIDTSDGISPDMIRICDESKSGCILYEEAIPLDKGLALKDALYYGESFELMFTMGPREANKLLMKNKKGMKFFIIGEITSNKKERIIVDKKRNRTKLKLEGYKHL